MNQPRSMYSKPIQFLYRLNYRAFIRENIEKNDHVLEIGSGLGFMKPLVIAEGAFYKGIEPIESVHKISKKLYGKECFFNEQLEKNCNDDVSFNKILSITVLDEINDKASFVEKIKSYCNNETKILLAVRNADFPFRRGTKVTSSFNNVTTNDLSYGEWIKLFNSLNLRILSVNKINRPLLTSLTLDGGVKNILIRFLDLFLSLKKNYMLCFILSFKDIDRI
tara:strand:- start:418 stop:1083 length:666 start_codon:yes stop_codon:yes gene_type:complete